MKKKNKEEEEASKKKKEEEEATKKKKEEEEAIKKKKEEDEATKKKNAEEEAIKKKKEEEEAKKKKKQEAEEANKKKKEEAEEAKKKKKEEAEAAKKKKKEDAEEAKKKKKGEKEAAKKEKGPEAGQPKKGKTKALLKNVRQTAGKGFLWQTADVYSKQPEQYVIYSIRDLMFYLMFMVLVMLLAFGDLDYLFNYYGNVVTAVLTATKFVADEPVPQTFGDIAHTKDIWIYVREVVIKVLHNSFYETYEEFEGFKALTESILVGTPRLRQKRVKKGTCITAELFADLYRSCYDYYSEEIEDKEEFGSGLNLTSSAWKYTEGVEDELSHAGIHGYYSPGGFAMNFTSDENLTRMWLQELEDNNWIQLGTRVVFVEFNLYSPNSNLFCTVRLTFEILTTGGVASSSSIVTSRFWHETEWDWFIFGCKIIFFVYTLYFTIEEINQIRILKEEYLENFWNMLDSAIVVLCYTVTFTDLYHYLQEQTLTEKTLDVYTTSYKSLDTSTSSYDSYKGSSAILTFMASLKLCKFAVLSKTTAFFFSTFNTTWPLIVVVTLILFWVVSGYAILGTIILEEVYQFRSFTNSFFTLFGLSVAGLYFEEQNKSHFHKEEKIYLCTYIIMVLLTFFSMYVAVIVNGYRNAVFELDDNRQVVYLGDVWNVLIYKICHFWKTKKGTADALYKREAEKMVKRNFDELLQILRHHGCRGIELALLLKYHNVRPGVVVPFESMCELYDDFLARRQLTVEVEGHSEIWTKLQRLMDTLDFIDLELGDLVAKMDTLSNQLF